MSVASPSVTPARPPSPEGSPRLKWVRVTDLRTSLAELRGGRLPRSAREPVLGPLPLRVVPTEDGSYEFLEDPLAVDEAGNPRRTITSWDDFAAENRLTQTYDPNYSFTTPDGRTVTPGNECLLAIHVNTCDRPLYALPADAQQRIQAYMAENNITDYADMTDDDRYFAGVECEERGDMRFKLISYLPDPGPPFLGVTSIQSDPVTGEIVWGATKSVIATAIMLVVISLFGFVHYPHGLLLIPLALVGGVAFGAVGMYFTAIVPHIETFNVPVFLFITPMFLFSGTFFPIENLPPLAQKLALIFPLTHVVQVSRSLSFGHLASELLWSLAYLLLLSAVFLPLAVIKMQRRLIK